MPAGRVNSALSAEMSWDLIRQNNTMRRGDNTEHREETSLGKKKRRRRVCVWPAVLLLSSDHGFDHPSLHLQLPWALHTQNTQRHAASTKCHFTVISFKSGCSDSDCRLQPHCHPLTCRRLHKSTANIHRLKSVYMERPARSLIPVVASHVTWSRCQNYWQAVNTTRNRWFSIFLVLQQFKCLYLYCM